MQNEKNVKWDLIIKPNTDFFSLKLKIIWQFRDLLFQFVKRDFVAFYKQTILGPIWFFLQPIFSTIVYVFIFSNLASISTDNIPPPLFYLSGITIWSYFSECLLKTSTVFRDNTHIFGKVYFPRLIMPLSIVISNLVKFAIQLVLLIICIVYYNFQGSDIYPNFHLIFFPIYLFLMASLGLGLGMIVSALTTKYRDLALLLTFGVQLLMYATPIVYPLSSLKGIMKLVVFANPMTSIVEGIRFGLLGSGTISLSAFLYTFFTSFLILLIGTLVFNRVEKSFIDTI